MRTPYNQYEFKPGELVRIVKADEVRGLVQSTYEDWLYHKAKWDNQIGNNYNVKSTPSYFILDKDKVIIKKPYDFEAFKDYFSKTLEE